MAAFNWNHLAMEESIDALEDTRDNIANFADNMKETLKIELLSAGMTGAVAEELAATSTKEVDEAVETFLFNFDSFVNTCRNSNDRMEELEKSNLETAG